MEPQIPQAQPIVATLIRNPNVNTLQPDLSSRQAVISRTIQPHLYGLSGSADPNVTLKQNWAPNSTFMGPPSADKISYNPTSPAISRTITPFPKPDHVSATPIVALPERKTGLGIEPSSSSAPGKIPKVTMTPIITVEPIIPIVDGNNNFTPPKIASTQPLTPIKPLPNNNLARPLLSYNQPSQLKPLPNITNLNTIFKPNKIDVPFNITLQNLKYANAQPIKLLKPLPAMKPIVNPSLKTLQAQPFNKLTTPKITPINNTMVKPIASLKPIPMSKPIANTLKPMQAPNLVKSTIPSIKPINNNMLNPTANLKPLAMPKPIVNTLKPIQTPNLVKSTIPKITPINNTLVKPIASIKPLTMPKPIVNTLRPIQTPSFVKYTIPAIAPINKLIIKPIESLKPLTMPKPIATNIKAMPMPKFAHVDIPSLNYMSKTFNVEMPEQIESVTMPKITPIKMTPIRLPEVEIPKYAMPRIAATEIKYQPINKQYVEKTIKLYDAKVMHDASRINSMISPSNDLQKYFNGRNTIRIDLVKFVQNAPGQRKEIINQAQTYVNSAEVKKLKALDAWRNEYDKFLALSSNVSNVVKETGQVDAYSLEYLENVKENLDTLTRKITDMGIDKAAMQQVIKSPSETVINPLMKEKAPMPSVLENPSLRILPESNISPKINIFGSLTQGVSSLFSSTVHAEEQ
ncbi:MAG: hypothetical protein M0R48_03900 [Candidatus Omnitrophica bacterium]|nr:hypothetical protein [Candidatus Omnitrophota bacterium]